MRQSNLAQLMQREIRTPVSATISLEKTMRKTVLVTGLAGLLVLPSVVSAQTAPAAAPASPHTFTGNLSLASEYIYRGIGQTNRKPALQGGFDYAHASGLYAGVWGSNVSWLTDPGIAGVSNSLELDLYAGFKNTFADDFSYDIGVLRYWYPGHYPSGFTSPNTTEVYGALGWKWITLKYSHSTTNLFGWVNPGGTGSKGSGYLDLAYANDLGNGWGVNAHVGHQKVKNFGDASYTDYKVGVTKDVGVGVVGLSYWTTNAKGDTGEPYRNAFNKDLGAGRLLVTFTKTF
jgi:uncharacterized protein (TIGR02001 family)